MDSMIASRWSLFLDEQSQAYFYLGTVWAYVTRLRITVPRGLRLRLAVLKKNDANSWYCAGCVLLFGDS